MKFSLLSVAVAALTVSMTTLAQDLLFLEGLHYEEYDEAVALGFSTQTVTVEEWEAMTTADFAKYKAIIVPDPSCSTLRRIRFLENSKSQWSPAVTGNIILIGTDPSFHFSQGKAKTLIDNSLKFAASGTTPDGVPQTGLYFALSCYYNYVESATVDALSYFGEFTVRGDLDCYNKVHLVASSSIMDSLDDESLSDWSCSVHEAFSSYPSVGVNGFQAHAIAQDILGIGSQTFGDGSIGLPYIISRGATPAKCGDGVWDKDLGEECDDGNTINGDGCSLSCKCEDGRPVGDGTCSTTNVTSSSISVSTSTSTSTNITISTSTSISTNTSASVSTTLNTTTISSTGTGSYRPPTSYPTGGPYLPSSSGPYINSSTTSSNPYPTNIYTPPPYKTPTLPTTPKIIGVEHIIYTTITPYPPHHSSPSNHTTTTPASHCPTSIRPIYDTPTSILPCYICAMQSDAVSFHHETEFLTVVTTSTATIAIPSCEECTAPIIPTPDPTSPPPSPPGSDADKEEYQEEQGGEIVVYPCKSCPAHTFSHTECITRDLDRVREASVREFVAVTPHVHVTMVGAGEVESVGAAHVSTTSPAGGEGGGEYGAETGTGTGGYYPGPTAESVTGVGLPEFTGGAAAPAVARGFGGRGGVVGVAAGVGVGIVFAGTGF